MWTSVAGSVSGAVEEDWLRAASISSSDTSRKISDVTLEGLRQGAVRHRWTRLS